MVTELLGRAKVKLACIALAFAGLACLGEWAAADPGLVTLSGLPVTVKPTAVEPGLPQFTYPTGVPSATGTGTSGDGSGTTGSIGDTTGSSGSTGSSTGTACSGCDPLATMNAQSWASQADDAAAAAGITPEALASVCLMESGCTNNAGPPATGGTISGVFQMADGTYQQMMQEVAAANPDLNIDTSLAGKMDPGNEAYAAAQYVADGVAALQNVGVANPTNAQVRDYYEFGPTYGSALAAASVNSPGDSISTYVSSSLLAANNISPSMTVGQFQQTILNKLGSVGSQAASAG